jgi:hypothetical protein
MYSITHVIHERSTSIPILKTPTTAMKEDLNEYGLKHNFFDPSKSSPPNEFMLKLQNRMKTFHSPAHGFFKKDDNRDSE